jgi:hypothetical protein
MMDFVSWDDDIPNWMESHKSHVPNHQSVYRSIKSIWRYMKSQPDPLIKSSHLPVTTNHQDLPGSPRSPRTSNPWENVRHVRVVQHSLKRRKTASPDATIFRQQCVEFHVFFCEHRGPIWWFWDGFRTFCPYFPYEMAWMAGWTPSMATVPWGETHVT